jgi:hypothetical protein
MAPLRRGCSFGSRSAAISPGVGITVAIGRPTQRPAAEFALDLRLTARIALIFAQQRTAMLRRETRLITRDVTRLVPWLRTAVTVVS